jgi:hypothetical protein
MSSAVRYVRFAPERNIRGRNQGVPQVPRADKRRRGWIVRHAPTM